MERTRLVLEPPLIFGNVTVIPVAKLWLARWQIRRGVSGLGIKSPVAVVLTEGRSKRVFRISGEEITLEDLGREAPEIRSELERLART